MNDSPNAPRIGHARSLAVLGLILLIGYTAEAVGSYRTVVLQASGGPVEVPLFFVGDGLQYRAAVRSMLEDGDLDLRNNLSETGARLEGSAALGQGGEWYPKHPVLMPIVSAPFYAIGGDLGLLAFNVLQVAALVLLLWLAVRRHVSETVTWAVTLWFAFGSVLRPYAYGYSPDVLSTLLVVGGYLAIADHRAALAGLLLGVAMWAKLPNVVVVVPLLAWAAVELSRRDLVRTAVTFALPVLALGALHAYFFGDPFTTPYDRVIEDPRVSLTAIEASHRTFFDVPFWQGLRHAILDRQIGLLVPASPVLLAPFGLPLLWRRSKAETLVLAAIVFGQIAFFAPYRMVEKRFLLTAVVLAAVPVGAVIARLLGERVR